MGHILLIEGHQWLRHAINELVTQRTALSIDEARDPVEAVNHALHSPPTIIILDTTWPEINGQCLSQMLREVAPQSKIVLLVDDSWPDDAEVKAVTGADAWVNKSSITEALPVLLTQWVAAAVESDSRPSPSEPVSV